MTSGMKKTLIWSAVIGGVSIWGYGMYKRIMKGLEYTVAPKGLKNAAIKGGKVSFKLFMELMNPSDLNLTLTKQKYEIYINDVFITTLTSDVRQPVIANGKSELQLDVAFDINDVMSKLKQASGNTISGNVAFLNNLKAQRMRLDSTVWVKYGILPPIPIFYSYEDTLKGWGFL